VRGILWRYMSAPMSVSVSSSMPVSVSVSMPVPVFASMSVSVLILLQCVLYDDLTYYPWCCSCFGTEIFLVCWVFLAYILHRSSISCVLNTP
jgi:hypothetical protein